MTTIFCDEAGNSGQNLFDAEQPFFILASNDYAASEAVELLQHVVSFQGGEPKFSTLRKTGDGARRLIRLFADPRLNKFRVVANVFHKSYMVVVKLVDLVAETLLHELGEDLYRRGANIAMANMLHNCMPVFCGETATTEFLQAFVQLIRRRTAADIAAYLDAGRRLKERCNNEDFLEVLSPFVSPELFHVWFDSIGENAMDPAIPALFEHINEWGIRKEGRFRVVHDRSRPILATQDTFHAMMAIEGQPSNTVGYDRRKFRFPLRAISLEQGDSLQHPQLQLADICAGAINHFLRHKTADTPDELLVAIRELNCLDWVINGVVPGTDMTPADLGTDQEGGSNPIDSIASYLNSKKDRQKR